jgi:putative membrane protein
MKEEERMRILMALVANPIALFATTIVPGITFKGDLLTLFIAGLLLAVINMIVRPIAMFLSIPLLILTLGLFYFVLNGLLLWGASFVLPGYDVAGLIPGMLGSLVIAIVNWVLGAIVGGKKKD